MTQSLSRHLIVRPGQEVSQLRQGLAGIVTRINTVLSDTGGAGSGGGVGGGGASTGRGRNSIAAAVSVPDKSPPNTVTLASPKLLHARESRLSLGMPSQHPQQTLQRLWVPEEGHGVLRTERAASVPQEATEFSESDKTPLVTPQFRQPTIMGEAVTAAHLYPAQGPHSHLGVPVRAAIAPRCSLAAP